jgi:hypothetical protein
MTTHDHNLLCRTVAAVALVAVLGAPARAEVLVENDDLVEEVVVQPVFVMADENFEQWIFREFQNAAGARGRLDSLLTLNIETVAGACGLSEAQRQKLWLAGRGDIKRFFDSVDELRRKFQSVKTDQNRLQELFRDVQPFHATIAAGPFGETSIFFKALKNTLTSEQSALYEEAARQRRAFLYRARIEELVVKLDEALTFRASQRRQLGKVLLEETRPPVQFGVYDDYVMLWQAAKIPEEKLKPVFDDRQWRTLTRHFEKVRGLEPFLKSNGLLPDGAPGAAAAGPGAMPLLPPLPAMRVRKAVAAPAAPAGF